jgi:acyl-CoA thioesterase-2
MPESLNQLLDLLDLERIDENLFRGRQPDTERQRVFGGQVAGQALVAAGRSVPADRTVNSLHAYFLRPGDTSVPIVYTVEPVRDGRGFSTRRVVASQRGRPIFYLSCAFHIREEGVEHQETLPEVKAPEDCPSLADVYARVAQASRREWDREWAAVDVRLAGSTRPGVGIEPQAGHPARNQVWIRADGTLPADDPLLHACVLTYASDLTLIGVALAPHGRFVDDRELQVVSLDHAVWFHRPFRADSWLLYDQISPSASAGRALATGNLYTADGVLVASVAQQGLLRSTSR